MCYVGHDLALPVVSRHVLVGSSDCVCKHGGSLRCVGEVVELADVSDHLG